MKDDEIRYGHVIAVLDDFLLNSEEITQPEREWVVETLFAQSQKDIFNVEVQ